MRNTVAITKTYDKAWVEKCAPFHSIVRNMSKTDAKKLELKFCFGTELLNVQGRLLIFSTNPQQNTMSSDSYPPFSLPHLPLCFLSTYTNTRTMDKGMRSTSVLAAAWRISLCFISTNVIILCMMDDGWVPVAYTTEKRQKLFWWKRPLRIFRYIGQESCSLG